MAVRVTRITKLRRSYTTSEWLRLSGFYAGVALLHLVGFGVMILFVIPSHYKGLGLGIGLTAYGLGSGTCSTLITSRPLTTPLANSSQMARGRWGRLLLLAWPLDYRRCALVALVFAAKAVSGSIGDGSVTLTVGGYIGTEARSRIVSST